MNALPLLPLRLGGSCVLTSFAKMRNAYLRA